MSTACNSKLSPLAATEHAWRACLSAGDIMLGLLAVEPRVQGASCSKWYSEMQTLWKRMSKMALEQGFEKTGTECHCESSWMTQDSIPSKDPKVKLPQIKCITIAVWGRTIPLFSSLLSVLAPAVAVKC